MAGVDIERPGTYSGSGEPGLAAVRTKFGDDMVSEFRAWPMIARHYFTALHGDRHGLLDEWGQEQVTKEVRAAEQRLARAKRDKDFAVVTAESYARSTLLHPLGTVPSVSQFREAFGMTERDRNAAGRAADAVAHRERVSTERLAEYVTRAVPAEIQFDEEAARARADAAREAKRKLEGEESR